ncbi:sensor histidine kinase [Minwuia sp.]|uniref:sensor histidine kinase n=1 Tax=Minwuia sp. TaxID=2493630 RepID=UPI003A8C9FBE
MLTDDDSAIYELDRFGLRFRNPGVERAFRQSWLKATLTIRVLWIGAGTLLYGFYSTLILYASQTDFLELHWFRFAVCLPLFVVALVLAMRRTTSPRIFDLIYLLVTCTSFGNACYCYAVTTDSDSLLFLYEMAALFVCSMSYFPALFRPIMTVVGIGTAMSFVTFWYVWLNAGQGWPAISVQTMLLLGLTVSGIATAYAKDVLIRRNYRAVQVERFGKYNAQRLARAANAASDAKSRFVAMVGHEFRTPLNAIIGYAEISKLKLKNEVQGEKLQDYMRDIGQSAHQLHRLVENVLTVATGNDQPLIANPENVDLVSVLSRLVNRYAQRADLQKVDLDFEPGAQPCVISADTWMVSHMMDELLSNAVKFTPPGGRVAVHLTRRRDGGAEVRVTDNGIGIDAKMHNEVFEAFTQTDNDLNRSYEGLGLGLTLVRKMVAAHGGKVRLTSKPGEGTSVTLIFPAREEGDSPVRGY